MVTLPGALPQSFDDLPIALTVTETAAVLRVGRNKVYDLVHQWQATSGTQGLRSVRLGRSVRIPRLAVLEFLGIVAALPEGPSSTADVAEIQTKNRR